MADKTVLVVDDEESIRTLLALYLRKEGFAVAEAENGAEALLQLQEVKPDLIILDIMMPVLDGLEVCQQIRKRSQVPIIMVTARTQDDDRILGLEMGADDYVAKPFNPQEVVARVKAVLRRAGGEQAPLGQGRVAFPGLEIDMEARSVWVAGEEVLLANKEMELLCQLVTHPGKAYSREQLLQQVWDYDYCGDTRTVDTHVKRLRKKLGIQSDTPWDIKTVWGIGYKFEVKR